MTISHVQDTIEIEASPLKSCQRKSNKNHPAFESGKCEKKLRQKLKCYKASLVALLCLCLLIASVSLALFLIYCPKRLFNTSHSSGVTF